MISSKPVFWTTSSFSTKGLVQQRLCIVDQVAPGNNMESSLLVILIVHVYRRRAERDCIIRHCSREVLEIRNRAALAVS